jgi:hypothetical protein
MLILNIFYNSNYSTAAILEKQQNYYHPPSDQLNGNWADAICPILGKLKSSDTI